MGILYRGCIGWFLLAISLNAFSAVSSNITSIFPNANTINTNNGRAVVVGVTSISQPARTAGIVIDARDKFGNPLRLVKTANLSPSKLKQYMTKCIKNPVVCAASTAIIAAVSAYLYTLNADGSVTIDTPAGTYSNCVDKNLPRDGVGGSAITATGPLPCASGSGGVYYIKSQAPMDVGGTLTFSSNASWTYTDGANYATSTPLYVYQISSQSQPVSFQDQSVEISDSQAATMLLSDPATLQIQPGIYPDVFQDLTFSETASTTGIGSSPDPDNYSDPVADSDSGSGDGTDETPPNETLLDMTAVPSTSIDISNFLNWGSRWLPHSCPADVIIPLWSGYSLTFSYAGFCEVGNTYIGPFVQIAALLTFIGIVFGSFKAD